MHFEENSLYHVYNRGNNKQRIFFCDENYLFFLRKVRACLLPYCDVIAYCLMPNHFYFLIHAKKAGVLTDPTAPSGQIGGGIPMQPLVRKIGTLLSSYTQAINKQENRTGSLFQKKTQARKLDISEGYPFICFQYIHQNPMKAGLVTKMEDWLYSSFRDYVGLRNGTLASAIRLQYSPGKEMD